MQKSLRNAMTQVHDGLALVQERSQQSSVGVGGSSRDVSQVEYVNIDEGPMFDTV